jgi:putative Mn2+ efflux pump MntP
VDGLSLIAVAVALAMDAFAVALAAGVVLRPLCFRPCFRLAFHFGLFQALMPVIGWLAGLTVQGFVAAWSHWIAFCLLVWVGGHMIREALAGEEGGARPTDPSRGMTMVALSLAMLDVVVWLPALVIGLVACAFTVAGLLIGARSGARWGRRVEVAGGAILIAIGLKILLSALFFDRAAAAVAG